MLKMFSHTVLVSTRSCTHWLLGSIAYQLFVSINNKIEMGLELNCNVGGGKQVVDVKY